MSIISVIGAGHIGLPTGVSFAELGHTVVCVETDPIRLSMLQRGELPMYEPGLSELVAHHREAGRLSFTNDYALAIPISSLIFVTVNTPVDRDGHTDTSFVFAAVRSVLQFAQPGLTIVIKSTVPVGTADEIAQLVTRSELHGVEVVSNPEFARQGYALKDLLDPDRIVIGAEVPAAGTAVAGLFTGLDSRVIMCSRRSAELAKYAMNAFLATRISFMNEMAALCEATLADVREVAQIMGSDRRTGPGYLQAGLGWGGPCLPKDLRALTSSAAIYETPSSMLEAVAAVNSRQRERVVQRLRGAVRSFHDSTVGVLGLAFKPETEDVTESPAVDIIRMLVEEGVQVRAHDPSAIANARLVIDNIQYCQTAYEAAKGSDALLLTTEWSEYLSLDWKEIRSLMRGNVVLDARNALNGQLLSSLGFTYLAIGRPRLFATDGFDSNPEVASGLETT